MQYKIAKCRKKHPYVIQACNIFLNIVLWCDFQGKQVRILNKADVRLTGLHSMAFALNGVPIGNTLPCSAPEVTKKFKSDIWSIAYVFFSVQCIDLIFL